MAKTRQGWARLLAAHWHQFSGISASPSPLSRLLWLACALGAVGIAHVQAQTATETVLHDFASPPKGADPYAGVIRDSAGNLYGTTSSGGTANAGVVFKVNAADHETLLYSFTGGADGANPHSGVTRDSSGNLYGTTYQGGAANAGVVYKVDATGNETVLYSFTGGADGGGPYFGVIRDAADNLYGTAQIGGTGSCNLGCGVVYKVNAGGQETVLHSFAGGADGAYPAAGVVRDATGNLYGTVLGATSGRCTHGRTGDVNPRV